MEMNFIERARRRMERDGWTCENAKSKVIDMICTRKQQKTALRIKQHGHIYDKEYKTLIAYGAKHSMRVLYIRESGERELSFMRVYPLTVAHGNGTQNSNV